MEFVAYSCGQVEPARSHAGFDSSRSNHLLFANIDIMHGRQRKLEIISFAIRALNNIS
jgi:hypothetical protein